MQNELLSPRVLTSAFAKALGEKGIRVTGDCIGRVTTPDYFGKKSVGASVEVPGLELLPGSEMGVMETLSFFGLRDPVLARRLVGGESLQDKPLLSVESAQGFFAASIYCGAQSPEAKVVSRIGSRAIGERRKLSPGEASAYQTAYLALSLHSGKPIAEIRQAMGLSKRDAMVVVPEDCVASVVSAVGLSELLRQCCTEPVSFYLSSAASSLQSLVLLAEYADRQRTRIFVETGRVVAKLSRGDRNLQHANYLETAAAVDGSDAGDFAVGDVGDNGARQPFSDLGVEPPAFDRFRGDNTDWPADYLYRGNLLSRVSEKGAVDSVTMPLLRGGWMAQAMREWLLDRSREQRDRRIVSIQAGRVSGVDEKGGTHFGVVFNNSGANLRTLFDS